MRTYIIAEAGVNHNGDISLATRLIDVAASAGADAVKFQTFKAAELASPKAQKAGYQKLTTDKSESQLDMVRKLELSADDHDVLVAHAKQRNIAFLSSPFDVESLHLLTGRFGMETIKIPSGEITNAPFLLAIARAAQRVILSTGMSTLGEIEAALGVLAFGFTSSAAAVPGQGDFERAFASEAGQSALSERVTILHCTTEYPAPFNEVNLRAMDTIRQSFGIPVGYSDHTIGIHVSLAAAARGAVVIEKHFTLDRTLPGPDHKASLEPGELRQMVCAIRDVQAALGDGIKRPSISEWKNREIARKHLVAARPIEIGEVFAGNDIASKRCGGGMSPFAYWQVLGRSAPRGYAMDEPLDV